MKTSLNRHEIREKALQALFPLDFNADLLMDDAIEYALLYEHEDWIDGEKNEFIPTYLHQLVSGVCEHKKDIDAEIQKYLRKGWTLSRISKTDRMILRIAVYELLFEQDTPGKVIVNEALELTKEYSDDDSRKFVNGVLSKVLTQREAV